MKIRLAIALTSAALLTACSPTTTTAPATTAPATTAPATTASAAPAATTTAPPAATTAKTCTVPDVVGMVHQIAQDTMQAAGLYRLREEDSTGAGRVLINDRNWTTTAQSVAAGQVVDCATEILLSAKKLGE